MVYNIQIDVSGFGGTSDSAGTACASFSILCHIFTHQHMFSSIIKCSQEVTFMVLEYFRSMFLFSWGYSEQKLGIQSSAMLSH